MFQTVVTGSQTLIQSLWVSRDWNALLSSPGSYLYVLGALFLLCWVLSILWVMKDITARTSNVIGQALSILIVWIWSPVLWLPIYLFLRPLRYKWDRLGRREALSAQVVKCPACARQNPLHHEFCVYCGQKMSVKCKECKSPYSRSYEYCPQCGAGNVE